MVLRFAVNQFASFSFTSSAANGRQFGHSTVSPGMIYIERSFLRSIGDSQQFHAFPQLSIKSITRRRQREEGKKTGRRSATMPCKINQQRTMTTTTSTALAGQLGRKEGRTAARAGSSSRRRVGCEQQEHNRSQLADCALPMRL